MLLDFDISPLGVIPGIFLVIFLGLFVLRARVYRWYVFLVPVILLLIFLQPSLAVKYPSTGTVRRLYIDLTVSNSFVERKAFLSTLDSLRTRFDIEDDAIFTFDSNRVESLESSFSKLSPTYHPIPYRAGIFLTDAANAFDVRANQANVIVLPFEKKPDGVFDAKIPSQCYVGEACNFSFLVRALKNGKVILSINDRQVDAKPIAAGFEGWVRFTRFFSEALGVRNLSGNVVVSSSTSELKRLPFVIATRKGIPTGYFYLPQLSLLDWRLSHALSENPYWRISVGRTTAPTVRGKLNFRGRVISTVDVERSAQPTILIYPAAAEGTNSTLESAGWQVAGDNLFRRGKTFMYLWPVPPKRANIFFPVEELKQALLTFSKTLQANTAPFAGGYYGVNKRLEIQTAVETSALKFQGTRIEQRTNPMSGKRYYQLPFLGKYTYGGFTFSSGVQRQELLTTYRAKRSEQPVMAEARYAAIEAALRALSEERPDMVQSNFAVGLSLIFSSDHHVLTTLIFLGLLALLLGFFWYAPIYRDSTR